MLVIKTDIQNSFCKNLWISYINKLNNMFDAGFIQLSDFCYGHLKKIANISLYNASFAYLNL